MSHTQDREKGAGVSVACLMQDYPSRFCGVALPEGEGNQLSPNWAEIGDDALWTLSSAKEGNGVQELRDNNPDTFWQSDGPSPHTITIQFRRLTKVSRIDMLVNFRSDESYTPTILSVKAGYTPEDLQWVCKVNNLAMLSQQSALHTWWIIKLNPVHALANAWQDPGLYSYEDDKREYEMLKKHDYIEGFCFSLSILENFSRGKDTHVRQVRVYGPVNAHDCFQPSPWIED